MENDHKTLLQLFSEGAAQATGENMAADAGQREAMPRENRANGQDAAAAGEAPKMTWEEVKAVPEFNREIQNIVRERLRSARGTPQAGEAALQDSFRRHIQGLEQQGEAMKALYPGFDLRQELSNPAFARMTAPDVGISVEDAYYALHRQQIQSAAMQVTAQMTAQRLSDAVRSGSLRPREHGASQGASLTGFDYRSASSEQKAALKKRIREAGARGEKLYPGQGF